MLHPLLARPPEVVSFRATDYDKVYSTRPHRTHCHELLYVLEGRLTLQMGKNLQFQAMPGEFLVIPQGTEHCDGFSPMKGLRVLLLFFTWEMPEYFQTVHNRSLGMLSKEVRHEAQRRLEFLRERWSGTEEERQFAALQLHSLLMLFYEDILRGGRKAEEGNPEKSLTDRVKYFLDLNFNTPVTLKDAAEYAGISPGYLSRLFHRELGISFGAYLTGRRLEAARHLLQNGQLQVGEIASRCGFGSSSYFIRVFKEHYGVTPRKHHLL